MTTLKTATRTIANTTTCACCGNRGLASMWAGGYCPREACQQRRFNTALKNWAEILEKSEKDPFCFKLNHPSCRKCGEIRSLNLRPREGGVLAKMDSEYACHKWKWIRSRKIWWQAGGDGDFSSGREYPTD